MKATEIKHGLRVRVVKLESTDGMMIKPKHLNCRSVGVTGTVETWVPGHGGDVWWVSHDNSKDIGAYCFDELEEIV